MIEELKTETFPLTLDIAKKFSRMAALKGDRDPTAGRQGATRLDMLYTSLRKGLFYSPTWAICMVSDEKGKKYRIDGGHSSHMLVHYANADFPEGLQVTVHTFRAKTLDEAMRLYEEFNKQGSTRTRMDLIKNRIGYESELDGVSLTSVKYAVAGIHKHYVLLAPKVKIDPLDMISPHVGFIKWSATLTQRRDFQKPSFVGAMFTTWRRDTKATREFWQLVYDRNSKSPQCPTRRLGDFMREIIYDRNKLISWPHRGQYVKCIHAWNAWRKGTKTQLSYHRKAKLPEAV